MALKSTNYSAKFPIFAMAYQPRTSTIVLGGGGGPSRSGVPNGFLLLRLASTGSLELAGEMSTGDEAVMSLSLYDDKTECLVVAGVNDRCWLLELTDDSSSSSSSSSPSVKSIVNSLNNSHNIAKTGSFNSTKSISSNTTLNTPLNNSAHLFFLKSLQCDTSPSDDGYLRVTRFLSSGRSLLTAGTDGCVRELSVPELRLSARIEGGDAELGEDVMDADGNDQFIVYINSKGSIVYKSRALDSKTASIHPATSNYSFKLVRFIKSGSSNLIVAVENHKSSAGAKKNPRLSIYDLDENNRTTVPKAKHSRLLPVSKNATCIHICSQIDRIALGFADGSLVVLSASHLASLYFVAKESHPFPVTGLAFDPLRALLLSASADGTVQVNQLPAKPISISSPTRNLFYILLITTILVLLVAILFADKFGNFKLNELEDFDSFYKLFPTDIVEP